MTKYIRIRNTSDNQMIVPRIALEKLGLSTKRDSAETIGRFGSGIKYAPIAALRKNWEWWFVGQDNNGPYYMQYVVRDEDGIDCVWYDYGTELKPSSFTLGAGELSWTDPFQIIREPIANAMDGVKEFGGEWSIDFVDEIGNADEYTFDVYITGSPELVDIINNIDLYFSSNRKALFKVGGTSLLSKETSDLRVFSQNVLIAHKENMPSIFDYEFDIVDLNEERTLKSEWDMCWKIGRVISSLSDDDLIYKIIEKSCSASTEYFEFNPSVATHYRSSEFNSNWSVVFKDIYGDNSVIYPNTAMANSISNSLRLRGQKGVLIPYEGAYDLLASAGIPNYMESLGEEYQYEVDENISQFPELTKAIAFAKAFLPESSDYFDNCGVLIGEAALQCKGLTVNRDNKDRCRILVSKEHLDSGSIADIVATLIHEYDHASTGIGDGYSEEGKKFRDLADRHIGKMIVKNYKANPFFIEDGVVCFRVSDIVMIGSNLVATTEHIRMLDSFLIKVGDFMLKASGSSIEENFGHEHHPHFCQDATVVSYPTFINVERIEIV